MHSISMSDKSGHVVVCVPTVPHITWPVGRPLFLVRARLGSLPHLLITEVILHFATNWRPCDVGRSFVRPPPSVGRSAGRPPISPPNLAKRGRRPRPPQSAAHTSVWSADVIRKYIIHPSRTQVSNHSAHSSSTSRSTHSESPCRPGRYFTEVKQLIKVSL